MKILSVVFLIFGTVLGSGFCSGKEIMVFFSRFGEISYLFIFLSCLFFFFLFYFFLTFGQKKVEKIEKSPFLSKIVALLAMVFSASMFAGMKSLASYFPSFLRAVFVCLLLVICFVCIRRGVGGLEKVNLILMPATAVVFFAVLVTLISKNSYFVSPINSLAGIMFCPLYVALNTSMSGIVIAKVGDGLSRKQKIFASAFASGLIFVFLTLGNFVLQNNMKSMYSDMPFLYLVSNNTTLFVLSFLVILIGCFTTLLSMCFTLKLFCDKVVKRQNLSALISVLLPFFISELGFSKIVEFLYPLASVFGVVVLIWFLIFPKPEKRL